MPRSLPKLQLVASRRSVNTLVRRLLKCFCLRKQSRRRVSIDKSRYDDPLISSGTARAALPKITREARYYMLSTLPISDDSQAFVDIRVPRFPATKRVSQKLIYCRRSRQESFKLVYHTLQTRSLFFPLLRVSERDGGR
jgi:hypothetical protein